MTKRQIHTFIRKYNEFNSRFGDEQFNIRIMKSTHPATHIVYEGYKVSCGGDVELNTQDEKELLAYVAGEVDYYENSLSQCEGGLQEQFERPEERRAFRQSIRYLKAVCSSKYYKDSKNGK